MLVNRAVWSTMSRLEWTYQMCSLFWLHILPLSYPNKISILILPWQNCFSIPYPDKIASPIKKLLAISDLNKTYLTLTGPFPGRWPRLICFPGRRVGFRWFLGGRWVVSSGRARNWKEQCNCLGMFNSYHTSVSWKIVTLCFSLLDWAQGEQGVHLGALRELRSADQDVELGRRAKVAPWKLGNTFSIWWDKGGFGSRRWWLTSYWVGPDGRGSSSS